MEFCKYGSLLSYMIKNRNSFINQLDPKTDTINPTMCIRFENDRNNLKLENNKNKHVKSNDYDEMPEDYYKGDYLATADAVSLKSADLLSWAFQIAKGMDYLASRKVQFIIFKVKFSFQSKKNSK